MLLANRIILLFYGAEFSRSIVALQILAWDILLFFLYMALGGLLVSMDRQNRMAVAAGACALLNIILNLILIPRFSYIGAGIATIATETVLFGLYYYIASKYLYRLPLHKIVVKPIIACAVMATFVYFGSGLNLVVLIIMAVVIYVGTLYLIKGVYGEDIEIFRQVIRMLIKNRGA